MHIGIDVHGCIDLYPSIFSTFSHRMHNIGNSIHVITGMEGFKVIPELAKYDIYYDHIFSIVDWHKSLGTEMWERTKPSGRKSWYCEEEAWNKSKGEYIAREHIALHFDDTIVYANYIPNNCTYIIVPKIGFELFA